MYKKKLLCFNTASVLIQQIETEKSSWKFLFQYSFCSYSTIVYISLENKFEFQYSFCSYSTEYSKLLHAKVALFQYSFCSYSTIFEIWTFSFRVVSIQLLFLFNQPTMLVNHLAMCFNTASVLIQLKWPISHLLQFNVSIQLLFLFNNAPYRL